MLVIYVGTQVSKFQINLYLAWLNILVHNGDNSGDMPIFYRRYFLPRSFPKKPSKYIGLEESFPTEADIRASCAVVHTLTNR